MKFIEETKLNEIIQQVNTDIKKASNFGAFFSGLNKYNLASLQNVSYEQDQNFFDELSFLLSVIITIINHPHISSMDRDEIIRADLAGHIENDSFQMVFKDPRLWREKEAFEMIPEEVYYHEHIDEMKIYENIFIGMLINLIDNELTSYNDFYVSLLPSIEGNVELVSTKEIEDALTTISTQLRKIRYIKNSFFYKQIKKCNLNLKKIEPTNILLKDRLYNYCFKFYKKFIRYEDQESLLKDLTKYYYVVMLKELNQKGFVVDKESKSLFDLKLNYQDYSLNLLLNTSEPTISCDITSGNINATSKILIDSNRTINVADYQNQQFDGEIVTPWNAYDAYTLNKLNDSQLTEAKLMEIIIDGKFKEVKCNPAIYEKYCPICKSRSIEEVDGVIKCGSCDAMYTFKKRNKDDYIWFIRVRRS